MGNFNLQDTVRLLNPENREPWGHLQLGTVIDIIPSHPVLYYIVEDSDGDLWQVKDKQIEIVP